MARATILRGGAELVRKLQRLPRSVQGRTLRDSVDAGASPIQREALLRVPVDQGNLRNAITETIDGGGTSATAKVGVFAESGEANVARFQEFGTAHHPAQPFLRPAFDTQKDDAVRAVKNRLKRAIRENS